MVNELNVTEGTVEDVLSFEAFEDLYDTYRSQERAEDQVYLAKFEPYFDGIGARYFSAPEFLFMGGKHYSSGPCAGLNSYPDDALWGSLAALVPVLDTIRSELGHPIRLISIYRNEDYNKCVGGVAESQHRKFTAADCVVGTTISPQDLHEVATCVRQRGDFSGGIGLYGGFVHIDVRGVNANWSGIDS